jgi:L-rhamnose-H+ transport protein
MSPFVDASILPYGVVNPRTGIMIVHPFLGVFFHWLGGLAAGSFYVPYRGVKEWAWEVYWLVGGVFSWIFAPWVLALCNTQDLFAVLAEAPSGSIMWAYFWGVMWGVGGLTFGLTMRYLGVSLGFAVALGYCAAFGTLMPPVFHGDFAIKVLGSQSGLVILSGIGVCLLGIAIAGLAGKSKEREMTREQKTATIKEFHFTKGILLATFSGLMSACFAYGLDAAAPIAEISARHGTMPLWTGLPKLCVVLLGGFTTNLIWCIALNLKNRTGYQYFSSTLHGSGQESTALEDSQTPETANRRAVRIPILRNYLLSALAGVVWYLQFFFYSMGETQMGEFKFSSWTLHMASIIIFSSLWGVALQEWKGSSGQTKTTLSVGLGVLVISTVIVGYGNYLGAGGR